MRKWLDRLGTVGVVGVFLLLGGLVWWNMCGQGPYGDSCRYSIGCKSFYCVHHAVGSGGAQVPSAGRCTMACESDAECGSGAACVVLGDDARDDLPPFGKPDRACLAVDSK